MSRLALGSVLLAVWLLLWGSASPANLLSGCVLIALLFAAVPTNRSWRPTMPVRPMSVLRLGGWFVVNLVVSNVVLSRAILSPRAQLHSSVMRVPLRTNDIRILTMVTNITALTPGTIVVQVDPHEPVADIWVHVLTPGDPDRTARVIARLEAHCIRAVGSPADIERLDARPEPSA